MRVEYQNTIDDFHALYYAFPLKKRLEWAYLLPAWLVVVSLPATIVLAVLGDWWALGGGWCLVLAFVGWVYAGMRKAWNNPDPKSLVPAAVWFDERHVGCESPHGWGRRDWSQIREVRETTEHILLFTTEAEAFAIPRRAFESSQEADEFATEARRCFAHSREPGYEPFVPPLPAEISVDNSHLITALHVRYENTAEELATVQFRGLAKAPSWANRISTWFWLAVFAAIVIGLMLMRGEERWAGQVGSFLAFIALFFSGLQFWSVFHCWRARRYADPNQLTPDVITITPAGVAGRAPLHENWHAWSALDEIAESERFVVFYITKPRFLAVIPKSAFASPLEAEQFVHYAREWKMAAVDTATVVNAPMRADTGNPYESPGAG